MIPTLTGYIESIQNSEGRFRTLERIFPLLNNRGEVCFTVWSTGVSFEVEWLGKKYLLSCFLRDTELIRQRATMLELSVEPQQREYIAHCKYLSEEMLVFDEMNTPHWCDVVLQSVPSGERLDIFVKKCCEHNDRQSLEWLLGSVVRATEWFSQNRYVHGAVVPQNVYVTSGIDLQFVNYQRSILVGSRDLESGQWRCDADNMGFAKLTIMLYVLACRPELYPHIGTMCSGQTLKDHKIIEGIWLTAKINDIVPLLNIASMILQANDRIKDGNRLNSNMVALLNYPLSPQLSIEGVDCFASGKMETTQVDLANLEWIGEASQGVVRVVDGDGHWRYVTSAGYARFGQTYNYAEDFVADRAVVVCDTGYGLIDLEGNYLIDPHCEGIVWYGEQGIAVVEVDGKQRIVDREGKRIGRRDFDWIGILENGLMPARRGEGYGFINATAQMVIDFVYNDAYSFSDGQALVLLDGQEFYIDQNGERV